MAVQECPGVSKAAQRIVSAIACLYAATASGGVVSADPKANASASNEIRSLLREFVDGFNSNDLDRIMKLYAEDYVDVNLRQPRQTKAERREYYRKILGPGRPKIQVTADEIVVAGSYAFARGTITLERPGQDGTASRNQELRFVEIWRLDVDCGSIGRFEVVARRGCR